MSILTAIDLISDVGRAALPSRKAEALHRLERLSFSGEGIAATPNNTITTHNYRDANPSFHISSSRSSSPLNNSSSDRNEAASVFMKFEAFILQTWLEILLPKVDGGAYGDDQAGGVWRSLMAEQFGEQLAKTGALGLARLTEHSAHQANEALTHNRVDLVEERIHSRGLSPYKPKNSLS